MEVAVILAANERDGCVHAVDVALERQAGVWQDGGRGSCDQKPDRRRSHWQQPRSVLKGFTVQRSVPQRIRILDAVPASATLVASAAAAASRETADAALAPIILQSLGVAQVGFGGRAGEPNADALQH
jgi:hypothetical protein